MSEDHSATRRYEPGANPVPNPNPGITRPYEPGTGPVAQPSSGPPHPAPAPDVPPEVVHLAQQRGFGPLVDVRREVTTGGALIKGGGMIVAGVVGMLVAGFLGKDTSIFDLVYEVFRFVALFFFFLLVYGVVIVIRGLVVGSRAHYLFAGGLVSRRRGGPIAVAWPEVELFKAVYNRHQQGSEGKVLGYQVHTGGRPAFAVPLVLVDGRDAFMDRIIEQLRSHGRPIG